MCDSCDWETVLSAVNEMLDDEDYEFAFDTLGGIVEWIEEHKHVTEKQKDAVQNIRNSIDR